MNSVISASYRMRTLINDLLSFSQVDRKSLDIKTIDLNKLMQQVDWRLRNGDQRKESASATKSTGNN